MQNSIQKEDILEEYPFEPHWIKLNGNIRMHYVDEGKGPILLLLHACPMWSYSYRNLIRELSAKYRVIAPDSLGFGLSDKPADYNYDLDTQVDCLDHLIEQFKDASFSVIMHGWGATIGSACIIRHSIQVRKIIIMNSMAFTGFQLPLRMRICRYWPWFAKKIFIDLNLIFIGIRRIPEAVRKGYFLPFRQKSEKTAIFQFIRQFPCGPEDNSFESLVEIEHGLWTFREHPVCLIWADKDWLYPEPYLYRWKKECPEAKIIRLPQSGRYITEEAYDDFSMAVKDFLKGDNE